MGDDMDFLVRTLKRVVLSFGLLYSYNAFMSFYNLPIPINIYTILITTIFGIPGFLGMIFFYIINYR